MGRAPCCEKVGLKQGKWTAEEDKILTRYIQANGEGSWRSLPKKAGLLRCGKSCRLRWVNYLRPDLKRGNITAEEEQIIVKLRASFGKRWSLIASHLPGRTDNELKNHWNTYLSKKIHMFQGSAGETVQAVVDVASTSVVTKKKTAKTRRCAMKKNKRYNKKGCNVATQRPEENVSNDDANVSPQRPGENVSVQRPEENVSTDDQRPEGNVSIDEEIPLPATPTQENETLPGTVIEGCMDLDPIVEHKEMRNPTVCSPLGSSEKRESMVLGYGEEKTINDSLLCPRGDQEKQTQILGPVEDVNGEMLCFHDIMDLNEIWTLLEETENCVTNLSEEKEKNGTLNTAKSQELGSANLSTYEESVACSSITSFYDDSNFDWDWESAVQGHHNQQCDEEDNFLSSLIF